MLLGKNFMPYLNTSDAKTVKHQYEKYNKMHDSVNPFKPKNFKKQKEKIKELTHQTLHATHLDIDLHNVKRGKLGLKSPVNLNYKMV